MVEDIGNWNWNWSTFSYSIDADGWKGSNIQDKNKVIKKILFGTKQLTRTDVKITLAFVKVSLNACKNLHKNELDNLIDTACDFF